ncbi:hypothetical protein COCNU_06G012530 [Cocos nucifera]|uniref:Uncharacterized protein n=1 Tax=Cocos nucifera TaxID=13894 RepID=A0A8K0N3G1_COCNU|nr:hypothetical protein COCNU_06G012530 [Cocos nucifera]
MLCETDVNHDQNLLQHSEKEVREILLGMMTKEEKLLVMQEGAGDGLRMMILDRQARIYHYAASSTFASRALVVVDNNLKRGEILETHAARVQRRRDRDGRIGEEGAQGIMDGELLLLLLMVNYKG